MINVSGTQFVPVDGPQIIRDSPTHGSAREHLKHKRKHAIDKLMYVTSIMFYDSDVKYISLMR